jgi:hypothetical protein
VIIRPPLLFLFTVTGEGEGSFPFTDELDVDGQIDKVNILLYESGLRTGDL